MPTGWTTVPIGKVCRLINGRAFKPKDWADDGLPIVRIQNLNNENAPFNRFKGQVDQKFLIDSDELLFAWSGTPGTSFGAHIWRRGPAILNQHIFRVLFDDQVFDKRFLQLAINDRLVDLITQAHGGAGLAHVTKPVFEATQIVQPSRSEQERIVSEVDKQLTRVDAGVEALKRLQAHLRRYRASAMESAFRPQGGTPWRRVPLRDLILDGPQNGLYLPKSKYGSGTPILRIDDYQDFSSRSSAELRLVRASQEECRIYGLRLGDLVVNRVNSPSHLGKVLLVEGRHVPALFESNMMRFALKADALPAFVALYLRSLSGRASMTRNAKWAVNQASINQQDVCATEIPLPSRSEQAVIVDGVTAMLASTDRTAAAAEQTLLRASRLRAGILKSAFDGTLSS